MIPSPQQQEVIDYCVGMSRGECVFIRGEAGSGKSFVIDRIHERVPNILLCALTGTAAQNIGGVTIHKMFSLNPEVVWEPTWDFDTYRRKMFGRFGKGCFWMFGKGKHKVLQAAHAIIVDEFPTACCHHIDAMDQILRHVMCNPNEAFGGKRMIFCGDLGQLQAVVTNEDKKALMKLGYREPFGPFEAKVFDNDWE